MNNIIIGIILALCIVLSAFFSGIETAFSCTNEIRIRRKADSGDKKAQRVLYVLDRYDKALTAILIGNNIVNLGGSSLATVLCLNIFGDIGAAVATGATTLLVLIFGEITPKCLAKEKSDQIAVRTAGVLKALMLILTPLIALFTFIKSLVLMLVSKNGDSPSVTEDELKYIVDSIEEEGVLEEQESEMVKSALEFDDKKADEILTPRVDLTAIDIEDSDENIREIIIRERYSRIPVYKENVDNIIGILHTRDYLEALSSGEKPKLEAMISKPYFIYKSQKLSSILSEFKKNRLHIAVVTDEYGGTLGIVTMEDLLEEIVGEIWDEDEEIENEYTQISEGKYTVSGDMLLDDLFELFEIKAERDDAESVTVGGFILEKTGAIPQKNQALELNGILFTVNEVSDQRVISVTAEKTAAKV